jgi:hypothetical protein
MDGQDQSLNNKIVFIQNLHNVTWWILVSPSGTITSHWNLRAWIFQHLKLLFKNYLNLKHVANNVWIFDGCKNICEKRFSCKCYTDGQNMNMYTLNVYIMHATRCWVQLHLCN